MLDIQLFRKDILAVATRLAQRPFVLDVNAFQTLESERKSVQMRTQELQANRNSLSKQVGALKGKEEDASAVMAQVTGLGDELKSCEAALAAIQARLEAMLLEVPNLPHESVPAGKGADANVEARRVGTPRSYDFTVKDHVDIGAGLKGLDFEVAAKISGARFAVMKGQLALRQTRSYGQDVFSK